MNLFHLIFHLLNLFLMFGHVIPAKIDALYIFIPFLAIFLNFELQKGLIFGISKLDVSSNWLFDTFNIPFIYIG